MAPGRAERSLTLLAACLLLAGTPFGQAQAETHLCTSGEKLIFSCTAGQHLASICASADFSAKTGRLRFRYGRPDHPESEWPDDAGKTPSISKGKLFYANKLGTYLRIEQDNNSIVVFSVPERASGLVVTHGRRIGDKQLCRKVTQVDFNTLPVPVGEIFAISGIVDR